MRLIMILMVTLMMVACNEEKAGDTSASTETATTETKTDAPTDAKTDDTAKDDANMVTTGKGTKISDKWDKYSYMLGVNFGTNFKNDGLDINIDLINEGMVDAMADAAGISEDEMRKLMMDFQQDMRKMQQEKMAVEGKENEAKATAFLAENKGKEGVVETASGLQYKVLAKGSGGDKPKATDTVTVHYEGKLLDGSIFDSSYKRNQTASFPLNGVIKGWTEGMQLMEVGDTFEFYIPPALGYGSMGQRNIPANSLLIFKVELKEIK